MPPEIDQETLKGSLSILEWIGLAGLGSFLATYSAWLAFPPELRVEGVSDKSKKFNTKSRIIIKNSGKLPAYEVKADAENICAEINTNIFTNCGSFDGPNVIGKLSNNETSEISITPGFHVNGDMGFDSFSYILTLKYHAKLLWFKKELSRKWKIDLENYGDGYSWNITIL